MSARAGEPHVLHCLPAVGRPVKVGARVGAGVTTRTGVRDVGGGAVQCDELDGGGAAGAVVD